MKKNQGKKTSDDKRYNWIGKFIREEKNKAFYQSLKISEKNKEAIIYTVGDTVYFQSSSSLPYIAEIDSFYEDKASGAMHVNAKWYYRSQDILNLSPKALSGISYHQHHDIFLSETKDENDVQSILQHVVILFSFGDDQSLIDAGGLSKKDIFLCRYRFMTMMLKVVKLKAGEVSALVAKASNKSVESSKIDAKTTSTSSSSSRRPAESAVDAQSTGGSANGGGGSVSGDSGTAKFKRTSWNSMSTAAVDESVIIKKRHRGSIGSASVEADDEQLPESSAANMAPANKSSGNGQRAGRGGLKSGMKASSSNDSLTETFVAPKEDPKQTLDVESASRPARGSTIGSRRLGGNSASNSRQPPSGVDTQIRSPGRSSKDWHQEEVELEPETPRTQELSYFLRTHVGTNEHKPPRVGSNFQADIEEFVPHTSRVIPPTAPSPSTEASVGLVWRPDTVSEESLATYAIAVDDCVAEVKETFLRRKSADSLKPHPNGQVFVNGSYLLMKSRLEDLLYDTLHQCEYQPDDAVELLSALQDEIFVEWTQQEQVLFQSLFLKFGDNLYKIADSLENKTRHDVVEYFFRSVYSAVQLEDVDIDKYSPDMNCLGSPPQSENLLRRFNDHEILHDNLATDEDPNLNQPLGKVATGAEDFGDDDDDDVDVNEDMIVAEDGYAVEPAVDGATLLMHHTDTENQYDHSDGDSDDETESDDIDIDGDEGREGLEHQKVSPSSQRVLKKSKLNLPEDEPSTGPKPFDDDDNNDSDGPDGPGDGYTDIVAGNGSRQRNPQTSQPTDRGNHRAGGEANDNKSDDNKVQDSESVSPMQVQQKEIAPVSQRRMSVRFKSPLTATAFPTRQRRPSTTTCEDTSTSTYGTITSLPMTNVSHVIETIEQPPLNQQPVVSSILQTSSNTEGGTIIESLESSMEEKDVQVENATDMELTGIVAAAETIETSDAGLPPSGSNLALGGKDPDPSIDQQSSLLVQQPQSFVVGYSNRHGVVETSLINIKPQLKSNGPGTFYPTSSIPMYAPPEEPPATASSEQSLSAPAGDEPSNTNEEPQGSLNVNTYSDNHANDDMSDHHDESYPAQLASVSESNTYTFDPSNHSMQPSYHLDPSGTYLMALRAGGQGMPHQGRYGDAARYRDNPYSKMSNDYLRSINAMNKIRLFNRQVEREQIANRAKLFVNSIQSPSSLMPSSSPFVPGERPHQVRLDFNSKESSQLLERIKNVGRATVSDKVNSEYHSVNVPLQKKAHLKAERGKGRVVLAGRGTDNIQEATFSTYPGKRGRKPQAVKVRPTIVQTNPAQPRRGRPPGSFRKPPPHPSGIDSAVLTKLDRNSCMAFLIRTREYLSEGSYAQVINTLVLFGDHTLEPTQLFIRMHAILHRSFGYHLQSHFKHSSQSLKRVEKSRLQRTELFKLLSMLFPAALRPFLSLMLVAN